MENHTRRRALAALVLIAAAGLGLAACAASGGRPLLGVSELPSGSDALSPDSGYVPDDAPLSIFDESAPAVSGLDPALRAAVQAAAAAAEADGQEMSVTSGWRSAAYQAELLEEAVTTYGSLEEARRWVSTPELSAHVTGDAVDIGPLDAQFWLMEHGAAYGLCQTYANERWHFELAIEPGGTCPLQKEDASG
ncbi:MULTISPECIES: M15 family metallopeptidase [unclassified Rathayibacter]|uniref:M15 family metallopeptidase n=1 Tax=unclassified Rathayibacter TaxID=2609250 RepID=UPI0006F4639B|nr:MULTISPECIES: M15 family metallopeptidase [unclassified Rathayibacter]KQQ00546.1 hypothetical protein ASF42_14405 [Rathayibacter sp. Leaf294]KQS10745.1 hypothetical protein ASG06_14405 [Rathayibacter sp. Leaf185]